jgi:8-oxo-dGTP pyrophosphatase MutT (NUDIX family)
VQASRPRPHVTWQNPRVEPNGREIPRPAATVVAAGQSDGGLEVLVLERGKDHRFLPGFVAFPGGAVEPQDADRAERWYGSRDQASRACAVRELVEEAGLALTAGGLVPAAPIDEGGDADLLAVVDRSPPAPESLREISRWIAPQDVPVRFDARFFAVRAPGGLRPRADGSEAARAWWAQPADILRQFAEGRCQLYWPTFKMMEALATCGTADDVMKLRVRQVERTP